jgi:EmrB/QacA subfamily drug resistance transporter
MDEKKTALIASTLASFMTPFMASSVNIALPAIGAEFGLDAIAINWVGMAFVLTAAVFLIPAGRLGDIHGRKRVFTSGLVLHTVSSALAACSVSGPMLIIGRALQGTGGAMIFGTGIAILTSVYPAAERGKVLGYNVASVYLGLSLGPVLGGFITQHLGWRSIFLVSLLLGLATVALVVRRLRGEWAEARGDRFDIPGAALFSLSLGLMMFGFSTLPGITATWIVVAGAGFLGLVLRRQARRQSPLFDTRLSCRNAVFLFSNVAALISYSATYAVTFLLSLYLQYIRGLTPQAAGLVLICQPAVMAICSPLAGRLSDRVEPRIVASAGMGVIAVGLWLLTGIHGQTPLGVVGGDLALLGFGFGLFSSPNTNAVMSSVEKRSYGVASSVLATMRLIGQVVSMGIVTILFSLHLGRAAITPEVYPAFQESLRSAFLVFSALCVAGIFASLARGSMRTR